MSRRRRRTASSSSLVAEFDRDVDCSAVEVKLAHGMTGDGRRGADRRVVLPVRGAETTLAEEPVAASVEQVGREPEPALLARDPVQLDERHLDPGMSVDARPAAGSQRGVDMRRDARRDREQAVVTQRAVPGHGRLDEMPEAVQLVAPQQVRVGTAAAEHLDKVFR